MKTIKCITVEGNFEFDNSNDSDLVYYIIRKYDNKKDSLYEKTAKRIGEALPGEVEFDEASVLGSILNSPKYDNETEIQEVVECEMIELGYEKIVTKNGYTITTPSQTMDVVFGSDFGGSECVKQIATITINEL